MPSEGDVGQGYDAVFVAASALGLGLFNKAALWWTQLPYTVLQLVMP